MDEIGKLRRSKKMAAGADKKGEQAGLSEKRVDELRAEIKEADNELNAIKEEQVSSKPPFHVVDVPSSHCMPFPLPDGGGHMSRFLGWSPPCRCSPVKRKGIA